MEDVFKIEIISPEKILFTDNAKLVKVPSYEGDMSILKNHISIITFLRPGIVKVEKKGGNFEEFFVQDGTIEFFNDTLVLLSSSVENLKNLSNEFFNNLIKETQENLNKENLTDEDRYILNHKIDVIKEVRV
jgi:F-type H+-transporting ATPase subunit epsilon